MAPKGYNNILQIPLVYLLNLYRNLMFDFPRYIYVNTIKKNIKSDSPKQFSEISVTDYVKLSYLKVVKFFSKFKKLT